jgi:hypothetical protein
MLSFVVTVMEKGVRRWVVDISKWDPSPHEFSSALSLLPQREHPSISRSANLSSFLSFTLCLFAEKRNNKKPTKLKKG